MSTSVVPIAAPGQATAPGVIPQSTAPAAAPSVIPLGGTTEPGETPAAPSAPEILPVPTPAPGAAPGAVPVATPAQAAAPALAPITTPDGGAIPSLVTQAQLASAVAQVNAKIAAGTIPILTKPNGTKIELTVDDDNNLGEEPAPEA